MANNYDFKKVMNHTDIAPSSNSALPELDPRSARGHAKAMQKKGDWMKII